MLCRTEEDVLSKYHIFVDGAAGTTGLRIDERLAGREEIEIIRLPEDKRKDIDARADAVNKADLSVLCLPDDAAREVVARADASAKICDTSTAHRTNPEWVYGFPEIGGRYGSIQGANRVAVPGCHASGFLALVAPLVEKEILSPAYSLVCYSVTGYSGGGKSMIGEYQAESRPAGFSAPRMYGLGLGHKHLPEMKAVAGIQQSPFFCPVLGDFYNGMLVSVPIQTWALQGGITNGQELAKVLQEYYAGRALIQVNEFGQLPEDGTLAANAMAGRDSMEIFVTGNGEQLLLAARFDNLGKGASGAAIQCMNLMLGLPETAGLVL